MNERKREMKFKVGDTVKVRSDLCEGKTYRNENGETDDVVSEMMDFKGKSVTIVSVLSNGKYEIKNCDWRWVDEMFEPVNNKILITSDGTTTLARLYEGNKVVKSAEAKCAPSDTYSFELGANLAFNRLVFGTDYKPDEVKFDKTPTKPEPPKHEYKAGQMVKVVKNTCNHHADIGDVITLTKPCSPFISSHSPAWNFEQYYGYISESDIEPYAEPLKPAEPEKEAVKLYCVESDSRFTKGNTYEFINGTMYTDNAPLSLLGVKYESIKHFFEVQPQAKSRLVPLVSRPAKVGEWVYMVEDWGGDLIVNTIHKCVAEGKFNGGMCCSDPHAYLVLDGYTEEEEPRYWNGKVVCVDNFGDATSHTVGKVYTYKDGVVNSNNCTGYNSNRPAKTEEEALNRFQLKFEPFLGEA